VRGVPPLALPKIGVAFLPIGYEGTEAIEYEDEKA